MAQDHTETTHASIHIDTSRHTSHLYQSPLFHALNMPWGPHEGEHQGTPGWRGRHSPELPVVTCITHASTHMNTCLHTPYPQDKQAGDMAPGHTETTRASTHIDTSLHSSHLEAGAKPVQRPLRYIGKHACQGQTCIKHATPCRKGISFWGWVHPHAGPLQVQHAGKAGHDFSGLSTPHMQALAEIPPHHCVLEAHRHLQAMTRAHMSTGPNTG
jgi:hypothetical protein